VALGIPWLGRFQTEPASVIYFDFECIEAFIQKRAKKLIADNPMRQGSIDLHFVFAQELRFGSPAGYRQLVNLITEVKPGLIIVDSLIRAFGGDENSSRDVSEFLGLIKKLMREHNFTVVFADHHRKAGPYQALNQQVRGSTDKTAFVDALLTLYKDGDNDLLVIDHTKSRYAEPVPAFQLKLVDTPTGGVEIVHMGERKVEKAKAAKEDLLEVLKTALADKDHITRQELKQLARSQGLTEKGMDKTLDYLLKDGYIVREEVKEPGKRGNAKFVYRWAQAPGRNLHPDLGGEAA
jgi:RecA-family ATPase